MHLVSPRTLLLLERDGRWLFLRGAPGKWFAGRLNGLGGRIEPGEDVLSAARREAREETGLEPTDFRLRAVHHVAMAPPEPPVILFVFTGRLPPGDLTPTPEGTHEWHPATALTDPGIPFLDDLRTWLPPLAAPSTDEDTDLHFA